MNNIESFPLCWPSGWPRNQYPEHSRFKVSPGSARDGLFAEIERLGGANIILSSNIRLRQDGLPHASGREPDDRGIAAYFVYNGEQMVFACDKYKTTHDNMWAIKKTIEAIRGIERWGASDMMARAFTGFKALPFETSATKKTWWEVLECSSNSSREVIEGCYRALLKVRHPDMPEGSNELFKELQEAYKQAISTFTPTP